MSIHQRLLVFLLLLLTMLISVPSHAVSFPVFNTNDSGPGSLRQVMQTALATPSPPHTIDIQVPGTISLLSALPAITTNLTISGAVSPSNPNNLVIDGNNTVRPFTVATGGTLLLRTLTVKRGSASTGAGIEISGGASATLDNVVFESNQAGLFGGGINNAGTLSLINSRIGGQGVANQAPNGAGIYNSGSLTIQTSQVSDNAATVNGGGIYNASNAVALTVIGSSVFFNTAMTDGANVYDAATVATTLSPNNCFAGGTIGGNAITKISSVGMNASSNWWGASNGPSGSASPVGFGISISPNIAYTSPLTAPPPTATCPAPVYNPTPLSGSVINIGSSSVGTSVSSNISFTNSGNYRLVIDNGVFTGANASDFTITAPTAFPMVIDNTPPAATTDIFTIQCKPSAIGLRTVTLNLITSAPPPNNAVTYNLECTGTALPPSAICTTQTQIPVAECNALVDLYSSTGGASWTDAATNNWNVTITPCSWTGVTCSAGRVTKIIRSNSNLVGTIPDLSALANLQDLELFSNQLTGTIANLSALTNLSILLLYNNQLVGTIPDLSALTNLQVLALNDNQLTGTIPNLSNLTSLQALDVSGNQLTGTIPLLPSSILVGTSTHFGYNAFTAETAGTATVKHPAWANTQTVPPTGIMATPLSSSSVQLIWTPIIYTADGGYYQVKYATTPGGPYTNAATTTPDKTANTYTVTGLSPNTTYYFVVETFTPAHAPMQQNALTSMLSTEVSAATLSLITTTYNFNTVAVGNGNVAGSTTNGSYASGTVITLVATPNVGSIFSGWSPAPCASSFIMPASDLTCTATFTAVTPLVLTPKYTSDPPPGTTLNAGSSLINARTTGVLLSVGDAAGNPSTTMPATSTITIAGNITGTHFSEFGVMRGGFDSTPNLPSFSLTKYSAFPPFNTFYSVGSSSQGMITVWCIPMGEGVRTALLTLTTDDPTQPTVTYPLTCTGLPGSGGIVITPDNHAPTDIQLSNTQIPENSFAGTVIGRLTTIDPDVSDSFIYTLESGGEGKFTIVGNELRVTQSMTLDVTQTAKYPLTIRSTDSGGLSVSKPFTITDALNAKFTGEIHTAAGVVGNKVAIDAPEVFTFTGHIEPDKRHIGQLADIIMTYTWTPLKGKPITAPITFSQQIPLQAAMDYTFYQGHLATLQGTFVANLAYRLSTGLLVNADVATLEVRTDKIPSNLTLSANTMAERSPPNTLIGLLDITDSDQGDQIICGVMNDTTQRFKVVGKQLLVGNGFALSYASTPTYPVHIRCSDVAGNYVEQTFTIQLKPVLSAKMDGEVRTFKGTTVQGNPMVITNTEKVSVQVRIYPDVTHIGKTANLFMTYNWLPKTGEPATETRKLADNQVLQSVMGFVLYQGDFKGLEGEFKVSAGYKLVGENIEITQPVIDLTISPATQSDNQVQGQIQQDTSTGKPETKLHVQPNSKHLGQPVELIVVATYEQRNQPMLQFNLTKTGWQAWDGDVATLQSVETVTLTQGHDLTIWRGDLPTMPGKINVYVGYRLSSGEIVYQPNAITT